MNLPRGDTAESKPGRELSAEIGTEGAIACIFVGCHAAACNEVFNTFVTSVFAAVEGVCGSGRGRHGRDFVEAERWIQGFVESGDKVSQCIRNGERR